MGPTVFADIFSLRIDEFLKARGSEEVQSSFTEYLQLGLRMDDDPKTIRCDMALVQTALISLVRQHLWVTLLMTFRRLPLNLLQDADATPGSASESMAS